MKLMHLANFPPTTGFEPGTYRTPGEDSNPLPQSKVRVFAWCGRGPGFESRCRRKVFQLPEFHTLLK